ncbi:hypothetical protein FS837_011895 [Tulasnella sp. UAMH 9824]|nr:hypothetical protein FS837_011895 [Tulasnella sp. UAMH 9824]
MNPREVLSQLIPVTEKKLWPAVGAKILFLDVTNQSLYPVPAVADQLFKYYEDILAKFEIHWSTLFRACDPNVTFPLPPHLRYLRPEIERFVYDLLPVLLHQARPDGKERELMLQSQRLTKAKQADNTLNSPREGTSQISSEKRLASDLEATQRLGIGGPRALQPQNHFPEPSDDQQTPCVMHLSLSGLNIPPDQLLKAREKVAEVTEFCRNKAEYPLLDLSHDEEMLLERSMQQANVVMKQVSQHIVPLFAITNDEQELWGVGEAVVALDQAQILLEQPTEKRFIFGLNGFNEYKKRLVRFLARGQELQKQGLAYQGLRPLKTQSLGLVVSPSHKPESSSTAQSSAIISRKIETYRPAVNALEYSGAPSSSVAFGSPSKMPSRKRNLEAYSTILEDSSNFPDSCKRLRIDSHASVDAESTKEPDILLVDIACKPLEGSLSVPSV